MRLEQSNKLAAIGYKDVEICSLYGKTPAEFGRMLKDNGMTASSGHYLLPAVKSEWNARIEDAKTLGLRYMVICDSSAGRAQVA